MPGATTGGIQPQYHPLAAAYFASVTGLITTQKDRINRTLLALNAAGIDTVLSDACWLRAGSNTGTNSPKTLRGVVGALDGSPPYARDGIRLDGATTSGLWSITAVTAHTLILDMFGTPSGQTAAATLGGLCNSAGITTSAALLELNGPDSYIYTRQGGTATTTGAVGTASDAFFVGQYNPLPQVIAITNDNAASPAINVYVDGFLSLTDTSGNTQTTTALNRVFIGARFLAPATWDTQYKGGCAGWMLFNRVLTPTEVIAATVALRNLDAKPVNLLTIGDSRTAQLSDATRVVGNWAAQLMRSPQWFGKARLCNAARNGISAATFASSYAARASQYKPDGIAVREGFCVVDLGTNDILAGDSAATILANLKLIWAQVRADGLPVMACTVYGARSAGFTAPQEAVRVALNALMLPCVGIEIDALFDTDALLTKFAESSFFVDDLHAANSGNLIYANAIARGITDFPSGGSLGTQATPATTGTMTVNMIAPEQTITPTGACTFNGVGGAAGQTCAFRILTSGASSYVLTWGTNFKTTGTLATGVTTAKTFLVSFRCASDGITWEETARTTAM